MTKRSRWARAHATSLVDRITVATRRGAGGLGASYDEPLTVLGAAKGARTLAVGEEGEEAATEGTLRLPPTLVPVDEHDRPLTGATELPALDLFALGSAVTVLGRTAHVTRVVGVTYRGRLERVDVTTD